MQAIPHLTLNTGALSQLTHPGELPLGTVQHAVDDFWVGARALDYLYLSMPNHQIGFIVGPRGQGWGHFGFHRADGLQASYSVIALGGQDAAESAWNKVHKQYLGLLSDERITREMMPDCAAVLKPDDAVFVATVLFPYHYHCVRTFGPSYEAKHEEHLRRVSFAILDAHRREGQMKAR